MNMFVRFTVAVTLGLLIASCASAPQQTGTSPSPTMISLERTLCYGRCPVYSITIYGDGTVRYEGKEHVNVKGSQARVINQERVRQLVAEFERVGYFSMNDAYTAYMITDAPSVITSITIDGRTKRVRHYLGDRTAPKELMFLENRVDEVAGSREWVGSPLEAQDTRSQPPGKAAADGLWEQGKILYAQKQYTEALDRFRQSIFQWSNPERADYVRQMETFVAQNKARAKQLRDEAYAFQQQGNTRLAVDKYRESLKVWPDRQLEEYVARLERGPGPSSAGSPPPRDERFCGPVDLGVIVPLDFAITYTSGPTHADWGSRRVEKVYANGDAVIEEIPSVRGGQPPPPQDRKPMVVKRMSPDGVKRLYARVAACEFFDLKERYWNPNIRDGGVENITVTANGRTHSVVVYYYDVPRYASIVSAMREEMGRAQ